MDFFGQKKFTQPLVSEFAEIEFQIDILPSTCFTIPLGKSFFLEVYKNYLASKQKKSEIQKKFLLVAAPTGTAAFNVGGETLHSLFQLAVPTNPNDPAPELTGDQLLVLQMKFKETKILIVDEKSMLSTVMLYQIDERLRMAIPENAHLPYGGISVVIMGDFSQLPPVQYKALFDDKQCSRYAAEGKNRQGHLKKQTGQSLLILPNPKPLKFHTEISVDLQL